MTGHLLGIDIGTSAIKLGILRDDGRLVASHSVSNEMQTPHPGWAEMEPEMWWRGMCRGIAEICGKAGIGGTDIKAVSFSALYPAFVPVGKDGRALRPAMLYCDHRSLDQVGRLRDLIPADEFVAITGNAIVPGTCSLSSAVWFMENETDAFERTETFLHANGYVAARLCGERVMDWPNASLSGMFETNGGYAWSGRICETAGIPPERLPRLVNPAEPIGEVARSSASECGLAPGTTVAVGAGDTVCSAIGMGLIRGGQVGVTCGTTDNAALCAGSPRFDPRFANCCHVTRDLWLFIATMSNTGAALEWFLDGFWDEKPDYERAFKLAESVPPGSGGVIFLPYLRGERSPIWDSRARGAFVGLTPDTGRAALLRAVLEGVAFAMRQNLDALTDVLDAPIDSITLAGGAAKSRAWNQIKADVTGKPVIPLEFADTSMLGAAMLAGIAGGVFASPHDAVAATEGCRQLKEAVNPDEKTVEIYEQLGMIYESLYPGLRDAFHGLGQMMREDNGF